MKRFKLFPNEHYDQQREKHRAYTKAGFKLVKQYQGKDGLIIRNYEKNNER